MNKKGGQRSKKGDINARMPKMRAAHLVGLVFLASDRSMFSAEMITLLETVKGYDLPLHFPTDLDLVF